MTSLIKPPRTMWQAARDLFERATAERDPSMWNRAYRLWVQAAATRARGEPFELAQYVREWLPTPPLDASANARPHRAHDHDERGWQPQ